MISENLSLRVKPVENSFELGEWNLCQESSSSPDTRCNLGDSAHDHSGADAPDDRNDGQDATSAIVGSHEPNETNRCTFNDSNDNEPTTLARLPGRSRQHCWSFGRLSHGFLSIVIPSFGSTQSARPKVQLLICQVFLLVVPALYGIATLTIQVLAYLKPEGDPSMDVVKAALNSPDSMTNRTISALMKIEREQAETLDSLLTTLQEIHDARMAGSTRGVNSTSCASKVARSIKISLRVLPVSSEAYPTMKSKVDKLMHLTEAFTKHEATTNEHYVAYRHWGFITLLFCLATLICMFWPTLKYSRCQIFDKLNRRLPKVRIKDSQRPRQRALDTNLVSSRQKEAHGSSSSSGVMIETSSSTLRHREPRDKRVSCESIWDTAATGSVPAVLDRYRKQPYKDIDAVHKRHGSVLTAAASSGNPDLVELVLSWGANVNTIGSDFFTALQAGAYSGSLPVVRMLLDAGASQTIYGGIFGTALNAAVAKGSWAVVKYLLREGRSVAPDLCRITTRRGETPLMVAVKKSWYCIASFLLEHDVDVNYFMGDRTSILHIATKQNDLRMVQLLLDRGADINAPSYDGEPALITASKMGLEEMACLLVQYGANVHTSDRYSRKPLFYAAELGLTILTEKLLTHFSTIDINCQDIDGRTAMSLGVQNCHKNIVKTLLERGSDGSIIDSNGLNCLHYSAIAYSHDITELLIGGASPQRKLLASPWSIAADSTSRDLLHARNYINATDKAGYTPLMYAIKNSQGSPQVISLLLQSSATDLDMCEGAALQQAAYLGYTSIVTELLREGAGTKLLGWRFGTPFQAAKDQNHIEVMDILLQHDRGGKQYANQALQVKGRGESAVIVPAADPGYRN